MATDDILHREGRNSDNSVPSLMKQFHKDFKIRSERMLNYMKSMNEREIDALKRQRLSSVTSSISNVTNISNVTGGQGKSQESVLKSIIVPASRESNRDIRKELQTINKTIVKQSRVDKKSAKSIFKNSIIQARIAEGSFKYIKDFVFSGPTETEMIVNAIENVERAVRDEDKVLLDQRSKFQKFTEGLEGTSQLATFLKKASGAIPTTGTTPEQLAGVTSKAATGIAGMASKAATGIAGAAKSAKEKSPTGAVGMMASGGLGIMALAQNLVQNLLGAVSGSLADEASKDPKVEESAKKGSVNIADSIISGIDSTLTSVMGAKLFKKKAGFLGAVALFGDSADFALSTALTNPLKAFKIGMKTLRLALNTVLDRSFLQGVSLVTATLGPMAGAISTVLIPLGKVLRPLFKEMPSLKDGLTSLKDTFGSLGTRVKETGKTIKGTVSEFGISMKAKMSEIRETLSKSVGNMLGKMKKKMGKMFIKAGVKMGVMGSIMLGVMGTIMSVAIAAWPFILGGLIIAALIGVGILVYKKWDKVKEMWNEYIVTPIVNFFTSAVDKFKEIKESITDAIGGFFKTIVDGVETAIRALPFGDSVADSLFGKKGAESATDKTVTPINAIDKTQSTKQVTEMNRIMEIQNRSPEEHGQRSEEMLKTMKATLEEIRKQPVPPSPVPPANVEDVATYITTQ